MKSLEKLLIMSVKRHYIRWRSEIEW